MLPVLRNRTFRHLFAAQVTALIGTGLTTVALALLAYDLAGGNAGIVLGTALALKMVAYVVIAPLVGGLAHRLPRRQFLVAMDLLRAAVVCCLPFVTEVWQIYVLILLLNGGSAGFTPTFQATIADVLPDEDDYTRALSLSRLAYDLENLASPMLAALALTLVSYDVLFVANGVTFLISAALVVSVQLPRFEATERDGGLWRNTTFGIRVYLNTPRLQGLLALSLAVAAAGAMVIVNTVIYVREVLGRSATDTGLALAAFGGGSAVAALALPMLLKRYGDRTLMLLGGALLTAGLGLGLGAPDFVGLLAVWFVLGLGSSLVQTPSGRLLLRSAHEPDRPAIYAAQFALSHACWLVAYPLAGIAGATLGLTATFALLAVLTFAATAVALSRWPQQDDTELEHSHGIIRHGHRHVHDEHHQHQHAGHEGPEPHEHPHEHQPVTHRHPYVIDRHHPRWP